ncbi:probable alpha-ketoglutarate-dependent hypophosphite dioxygenase [Anguilla anguilla]|uniref:probable alpha-ketoglutarate-dependent hypophosphite dioxygenase n=1 Tax=Anguilla anguilla TaxID=7936 RepID=UPI0015A78EE6|nr:probable alpha-ketoglutarate-dependent hypophosphite dioxygenase [Anguilla anguilla]
MGQKRGTRMKVQDREPAGYQEQETNAQTGGSRASDISASYAQQGFLSGLPVLDALELQAAREAFGKLEREFGKEYTQYSLHNVHLQYDWVMALAKHPKVLEPVSTILGPDVILLDSRFICKYPVGATSNGQVGNDITTSAKQNSALDNEEGNYGKAHAGQQDKSGLPFVAWHQDMRYWGLAGGPVLSVWLALDDSLEENGALQVIPGSHCSGILPHQPSPHSGNMLSVNQEIPEELVKIDEAVLCPLLAGQMSVHDGLLIHGSDPNTSGRRRCGFVIRFVPTCAYPIQDPDRPRSFNATVLVCGTDKFRNFPNNTQEL